jgi:ABC-type ATPase involved in cell division
LTTHNQEIVNKLKRRVITIRDGKIVSDKANAGYNIGHEKKTKNT